MTLSELASLVQNIGVIATIVIALLAILWLLIQLLSSIITLFGKFTEKNLEARGKTEADYLELSKDKAQLDKKYTVCREELATIRGQYALLDNQKDTIVDKLLDDTHDFDRELQSVRKLLGEKDTLIKNLETQVCDKDIIIEDLSGQIKLLKAGQ